MLKTQPVNGHFHVEKVPIIDDWLTDIERPHDYTQLQQSQMDDELWYRRESNNHRGDEKQFRDLLSVTSIYQRKDKRYVEDSSLNTNEIYANKKLQTL